ncbi:MAG: sugar ABC transporter permease [Actinobacteria bacterium]|nr:sugar ABC transporter permease [Actinomycetota bacterium]
MKKAGITVIFSSIYKNKIYYLFLLPFYFFFIYFLVIPAVKTFYYTFFKINNVGFQLQFAGFTNYKYIFSDFRFWLALRNTAILVVILVPLVVITSLFIANSIYREKSWLKTFVRAAIYIPTITSEVVLIMSWKFILNPRVGILNYIISIFGIPYQDWLGTKSLALLSMSLVLFTFVIGAPLIIYLASLGTIPDTYYEAALIDGANQRQMFFNITLPLLKPTTLYIIVTSTIGFFQIFSTPYIMTDGGPVNSTTTLVLLLYKTAFTYENLGAASVIGVVLFIMCTIIALIQYKYLSRDVVY